MKEEVEEKEPLAPTQEQLEDVWTALKLKGKPDLITLSKELVATQDDIETFEAGLDKENPSSADVKLLERMAVYLGQLLRLRQGYIENRNMVFIENHREAIKQYHAAHGEQAALPVGYDKHGLLFWVNREKRRKNDLH